MQLARLRGRLRERLACQVPSLWTIAQTRFALDPFRHLYRTLYERDPDTLAKVCRLLNQKENGFEAFGP